MAEKRLKVLSKEDKRERERVWKADTKCVVLTPRWGHQSAAQCGGVWQLLIQREGWRDRPKGNMTELWVKLSRRQKRESFFSPFVFVHFFQPHLSHFLFPPLLPLAASHRSLSFWRGYQHICLDKLVFPSISTPCFPKASLDPRTALLALCFPSGLLE